MVDSSTIRTSGKGTRERGSRAAASGSLMIRPWKALRSMGMSGSSATIPTNSPEERLEIVDAGMEGSNCRDSLMETSWLFTDRLVRGWRMRAAFHNPAKVLGQNITLKHDKRVDKARRL